MGLYKIRPGSGRPLGGGYRPEWADYFGDERASLIKFGMPDTPEENETLRRARCEAGHVFSVTERSCPRCTMRRVSERERAEVEALVLRVRGDLTEKRLLGGHCRHCGEVLPRKKGPQGPPKIFCNAACRDRHYRARGEG